VPGDWGQANAVQAIPGVLTGGDANGRLSGDWVEGLALWEHLSKSRFIQGNYVGGTGQPTADSTDKAPRNAFNGFLMLFRSSDYFDTAAAPTEQLNLVLGAGIPVNVLAELDRKIDDGLPQSGVLRHALTTAGLTFDALSQSSADCVAATTTPPSWDIATNQQLCNAVYLY